MDNEEDQYICVGVCMADPDSGYCLGCGRPPLDAPAPVTVVVEPRPDTPPVSGGDPDSPT